MCVWGGGGVVLGIHLEAKGVPDWNSLGTTNLNLGLIMCALMLYKPGNMYIRPLFARALI